MQERRKCFVRTLLLSGMVIAALSGGTACGRQGTENESLRQEEKKEETEKTGGKEAEKKAWDSTYPQIQIETELECHDSWQQMVDKITKKYSTDRKGEVIFYGASNFARWEKLDAYLREYKVQNHAFGGSTDAELVGYSDQLLFPYEPAVVFFQTGSNDYGQMEGTDQEKIEKCMAYKKQMFEAFHQQMPEAKFVIMSGLLLPGSRQYLDMTLEINRQLEQLAAEKEYLYFVDANAMTYDGADFNTSLFEEDGVHLNREGQKRWSQEYIKPALERVIEENGLDSVRRK